MKQIAMAVLGLALILTGCVSNPNANQNKIVNQGAHGGNNVVVGTGTISGGPSGVGTSGPGGTGTTVSNGSYGQPRGLSNPDAGTKPQP